ncbi:MAG TPA: F0F1 ATP synthase subunit A [Gemmatimonadales bacterium]|nr:F0F1 ATP synthase subunit A [Gemmatimonadales bacterium]
MEEEAHIDEGHGEAHEAHGPLDQFEIEPLIPIQVAGYDVSFTNSALFMFIAGGLVLLFLMGGMRHPSLIPGRLQSAVETLYEFTANLVNENAGKEGLPFFSVIFTIFMFIMFGNLIGLVPGAFTFTSHIIVTFTMAICVVIGVTIVGFWRHGLHFFEFFVPHGAPKFMLPFLVPIEVLSYCVRPISLSVRLFVNMMAGHTMLHVFATFVVALGLFGFAPLLVVVALYALEIAIAVLQAYVFTILSTLYLRDSLHMH